MTAEPDLLSLVLTLRLLSAGETKAGFGRAAHALALEAVRQTDPLLARQLHDADGLKPFTVSDLIGHSPRRELSAEWEYGLRFTALTGPVAQALQAAAREGALAPGREVRLAEAVFGIVSAAPAPTDGGAPPPPAEPAAPQSPAANAGPAVWAGAATYESLSAPWLLGRAAPDFRLAFRFASPTAFKSGEKHVPALLPGWVFGSLLEKWNAFAPVALPPETRRFAEECLALSGFELRSRPAMVKEGGVRVGAVGLARYTALNRDRYWLSVMNLLADFALYAGVGVGATMGLGQCRRVRAA